MAKFNIRLTNKSVNLRGSAEADSVEAVQAALVDAVVTAQPARKARAKKKE